MINKNLLKLNLKKQRYFTLIEVPYKTKRSFTLIELIIVIVVIGILAGMALPKFLGVQRDAKVSAMFRDIDTLEKAIMIYYQDNDKLPLYDLDDNTFNVSSTLQDTLNRKNDNVSKLKVIDKSKLKDYLGKDTKYGKDRNEDDEYLYSELTGNVYYSAGLQDGKGITYHTYENAIGDPVYKDENGDIVSPLKDVNFGETLLTSNRNTLNEEPNNNFTGLITKDTNLQIEVNGVDLTSQITTEPIEKEVASSFITTVKAAEEEYVRFTLPLDLDETAVNKVKINLPEENKTIIFLLDFAQESLLQAPDIDIDTTTTPYELVVNYPEGLDVLETQYIIDSKETTTIKPDLTPLMDGKSHTIDVRYKTTDDKLSEWANVSFSYSDGTNNEEEIPIPNPILLTMDNFHIGNSHSLAIVGDELYSWGYNRWGQLGIGNTTDQITPVKVTLPNEVKPQSVFTYEYSSMAIGDDGNLYAWGYNVNGHLGLGNRTNQTTPQLVTLPNGVKPKSIELGSHHTMLIGDDGNLYTWGRNDYGQLGIGNITDQITPVKVTLPNGVKPKSIVAGYRHSFAIGEDDNLYAWGDNLSGELGIGNTINQLTPIKVGLPNGVKPKFVDAGFSTTMVIGDDNNIYFFGRNVTGLTGDGNTDNTPLPKLVNLPNGTKPIDIAVGDSHAIAIGDDGNVYAWGNNGKGQLGISGIGNTNQLTPKLVTLPNGIIPKDIRIIGEHSMLRTDNEDIYVWGRNDYGELDKSKTNIFLPKLFNIEIGDK